MTSATDYARSALEWMEARTEAEWAADGYSADDALNAISAARDGYNLTRAVDAAVA